jgi:hypothetical protein
VLKKENALLTSACPHRAKNVARCSDRSRDPVEVTEAKWRELRRGEHGEGMNATEECQYPFPLPASPFTSSTIIRDNDIGAVSIATAS